MSYLIRPSARRALVIAVAAMMLLAGSAATAAEDALITKAREHYQKGTAFYDLGRYQDAIREFEAAYEAKPDPAFLYNLAQAHRLAGNTDQALHFYRTYLRRSPKAPNREEIEDRIAALEKLQDQKKGTQTPPNHVVPPAGTTQQPPADITLPPPGPMTTTTPPVAMTSPPAAPPGAPPGAPVNLTAAPTPDDPGRTKRIAGIVAGGVGVVGLVTAALFGSAAQSAAEKITEAGNRGVTFGPDLQETDKRGRRYQTLEFVSLGVGLVALGGGAFLYFTAPKPESRFALVPVVSPDGGAALLRGSF